MEGETEFPVSMPEVAAESAEPASSGALMIAFSWSASEVVLLLLFRDCKKMVSKNKQKLAQLTLLANFDVFALAAAAAALALGLLAT